MSEHTLTDKEIGDRILNYLVFTEILKELPVKDIRVKKGLAYAVQSILRIRKNTGVFLFYAQIQSVQRNYGMYISRYLYHIPESS